MDAANVTFERVCFVANFADVTAALDVNACDVTFTECRFLAAGANLNAVIWIQDAAANASDRITIERCYLLDVDAANTHFVNFAGTGDGHKVIDNVLIGDFGSMGIGGAGAITNCTVILNKIYNASNVNDSHINIAGTGIVMLNLAGGVAAQANGFLAAACAIAENYYVDIGDRSAILDPIAT